MRRCTQGDTPESYAAVGTPSQIQMQESKDETKEKLNPRRPRVRPRYSAAPAIWTYFGYMW